MVLVIYFKKITLSKDGKNLLPLEIQFLLFLEKRKPIIFLEYTVNATVSRFGRVFAQRFHFLIEDDLKIK